MDERELTFERDRIIAGRYRLVELVGNGSMGAVWKAEHLALGTAVAIKLLHHSSRGVSPEIERRFAFEARAAAAVRGPHVVQIMDHGVDGGIPYIVLELLEGESLEELLGRRRRLSLRETTRLVGHVARALAKAREVGYIHRDLKPSNIFLARGEARAQKREEWTAKVLDFGLAKSETQKLAAEQSSLTEIGAIVGTPKYMSPEQIRGGAVDHRSDLWSLALIAYECALGCPAFDGDTLQDLMLAICDEPPRLPSRVDASLPEALDRWFLRAVAKDPAQRFQSAQELTEALAAIESGHVGLKPVPRPPRPSAPRAAPAPGLESTVDARFVDLRGVAVSALHGDRADRAPDSREGDAPPVRESGPERRSDGSTDDTVALNRADLDFDEEATVDSRRGPAPRMSIPTGDLLDLYQSPLDLDELTTFWEGTSEKVEPRDAGPTVRLGDRLFVRHGDAQIGPVQVLEVLQAVRDGHISLRSMARPVQATAWQALEELRLVDDAGRALDLKNIQPAVRPSSKRPPPAPSATHDVAAEERAQAASTEPAPIAASAGQPSARTALLIVLALALIVIAALLARG